MLETCQGFVNILVAFIHLPELPIRLKKGQASTRRFLSGYHDSGARKEGIFSDFLEVISCWCGGSH